MREITGIYSSIFSKAGHLMAYLYKLDFYVILLINTKGRENAKVFFVLFTKFQTLCSVEQFDIETTDGFFCLKFSCWLCVFIKNAFIFLCIICIYINVLCVFLLSDCYQIFGEF